MLKKQFFIFSLLMIFSSSVFCKTIRTGYLNYDDGFMRGSSFLNPKDGYGYEYLQVVASYTGWDYEYVYGDWAKLYSLFLNGELDVLVDVSYSKERETKMYFPDYAMGEENYNIYVLPENDIISAGNLMSLNGKKIGTNSTAVYSKLLENWIKENRLSVDIVYYTEDENRNEDFLSGRLDGIVEIDLNNTFDWEPVFHFGNTKFYMAVSLQRPDLVKELNDALNAIYRRNPHYNDQLNARYFSNIVGTKRLELDESEWVKTHTAINVGCYSNYLPFCDYDVITGRINGFARDYFNLIFEELDIVDKEINLKFYNNTDSVLAALKNKEIDCIFPSYSSFWITEEMGLLQSSKAAAVSMNILYKNKYDETTDDLIAVSKDNPLQIYYVKENFPRSQMIVYDSTEDALNAVVAGKCGCTVLNGFKSQYYTSRLKKYRKLKVLNLRNDCILGMLFLKDNSGLLHLINRGMSMVPETYISRSIANYGASGLIYTKKDFISDNLELFVFLFALLVVLAGALIVVSDKLKMYIIYDPLTHLMNRKKMNQYLNAVYKQAMAGKGTFTLLIMDLDDFKKINDSYGHNCGDAVLQYVATIVSRGVKKDDYVFRWGGEEILVVLRTEKEIALKVAERIRFDIQKEAVRFNELKIPVTATIGVSAFDPNVSLKDMFEEADRNLYQGKNHGKNQVVSS